MTILYREDDLPPGMDESTLKVFRYDDTSGWVQLTVTDRNLGSNTITVELDHLSEFALAGPAMVPVDYLPVIFRMVNDP